MDRVASTFFNAPCGTPSPLYPFPKCAHVRTWNGNHFRSYWPIYVSLNRLHSSLPPPPYSVLVFRRTSIKPPSGSNQQHFTQWDGDIPLDTAHCVRQLRSPVRTCVHMAQISPTSMALSAIDKTPRRGYKNHLRPPPTSMLPPSTNSTNSTNNNISMAWLDRSHKDSPFYESPDSDKHEATQLLVLVFRAYFSPIIFVHGVCGNLLSLVILCRLHRRAPGRFNLYAIAIAVLFLLLLVFDTFLDDFFGRGLGWLTQYRFNLKMDQISSLSCKLITYVTDSSGFMATTILAIFALDRVRTIYSPLQFRGDRRLRCTTVLIAAIIVIGLALFSPTFVFYDIVVSDVTNQTSCTLTNPSLPGATYILLIYVLGSYTLPTLVIIICNFLIACQLVAIKRKHRKCGIDVSSRRDIRRIIGHLGINTAFLLLMIPLVVVILMRYESSLCPWRHSEAYRQRLIHLSRFFSSLLSVYFSSSFWVLFLFLPTFRDAVLELLLACPLIATSVCGPCLYRHMTYGGARRFRAKSMTPSLMFLSHLPPPTLGTHGQGFQSRGSLPSSGLAVPAKPIRSISTPSIVHLKT